MLPLTKYAESVATRILDSNVFNVEFFASIDCYRVAAALDFYAVKAKIIAFVHQ